jgi:Family of unknown function (DUF6152)
MTDRRFCGLVLSLGLLLAALPTSAHHSFAATFDPSKPIVVQVVVTQVKWENPHILIYADAKDKTGKVEKWTFESFPPGVLHRKGLRPDRLKPGATVTFKGFRAKDGSNFGHLSVAVFPDGKSFCVQFPGASDTVGDAAYDGCTGSETGQYR